MTRGFSGSASGLGLKAAMIGVAATGSGRGYWLVGGDGGIFSYGDAGSSAPPATFTRTNPLLPSRVDSRSSAHDPTAPVQGPLRLDNVSPSSNRS